MGGYLNEPSATCSGIGHMRAYFDVLPDVGLWVDDAHVRRVAASVDHDPVVQLKKRMLRIVLGSQMSDSLARVHENVKGEPANVASSRHSWQMRSQRAARQRSAALARRAAVSG